MVAVAPTSSLNSLSNAIATAPTSLIQPAPAAAPVSYSLHNQTHSEKECAQKKHVVPSPASANRLAPAPSAPSAASRLTASLKACFDAPIQSHIHHASQPAPDIVCHCLIVDESRLVADSVDAQKYALAMTMASDRKALHAHVLEWMQGALQPSDVSAIHVPPRESRKLHINFTSLVGLGRALASSSFLVRCGSLGANSHWTSQPCGPKRDLLPEMLQFSCTPTHPKPLASLNADVTALLASMNLEYTALWFSTRRPQTDGVVRVHFKVLPKKIDGLAAVIAQLHQKYELLGGKIRVHAPNDPTLLRCSQCNQLGHHANRCSEYNGFAIRLLMKDPISYHSMTTLASVAGARVGYLGSSVDEMKPSHRVTLLFGLSNEIDGVSEEAINQQLIAIMPTYRSLLFSAPVPVEVKHRMSECRECGALDRPHECPFASGALGRSGMAAMMMNGHSSGSVHPSVATSRQLPSAAAAASNSDARMCNSWRASKKCPRREKGIVCTWTHPMDFEPNDRTCWSFRDEGHCAKGTTCLFVHKQPTAPVAPAVVVAVVAPGPRVEVAAAAPSTPVVSDVPPPSSNMDGHSVASALSLVLASNQSAPSKQAAESTKVPRAKRGRPQSEVENGGAVVDVGSMETDSTREKNAPATPSKKQRASAGSASQQRSTGIPIHATAFGALNNDDDDEEEQKQGAPPPGARASEARAPVSSLSSIASPTKTPSTSKKKGQLSRASSSVSSSDRA